MVENVGRAFLPPESGILKRLWWSVTLVWVSVVLMVIEISWSSAFMGGTWLGVCARVAALFLLGVALAEIRYLDLKVQKSMRLIFSLSDGSVWEYNDTDGWFKHE
jgi:hypothetical protein